MPENQSINADIYGIYQSKRMPASGKRKAELLRLIAQVEKVDIAQTIAVGDGANDLPIDRKSTRLNSSHRT